MSVINSLDCEIYSKKFLYISESETGNLNDEKIITTDTVQNKKKLLEFTEIVLCGISLLFTDNLRVTIELNVNKISTKYKNHILYLSKNLMMY